MRLGIFCGSSLGRNPGYAEAAREVGEFLARQGIELVYGGGRLGLMGVLADAALAAGGSVTGVIPRSLADHELGHPALTRMCVVESMHERKAMIAELSTGFMALPGGPGTLDEIVEQWTWAQLGFHAKPCGFLNTLGYFDPFRATVRHMVGEGFLAAPYGDMLLFADQIGDLLALFQGYEPPPRKFPLAGNNFDVMPR